MVSRAAFGELLRQWRMARRMSQQQLAIESEVSTRHISYVENGKSAPSREMVLILASALDLPLRERNSLLSAAGYAPVYRETNLSDPEMTHIRRAIDAILEHQEPYPTAVLNRSWDLVKMNNAGARLFALLMDPPVDPLVASNVMHAIFHPDGIRPYVLNWEEIAAMLLDRLYREAMVEPASSDTRSLLNALIAYPDVPTRLREIDLTSTPKVSVTLQIAKGPTRLDFFSTITTLGTPMDVTVQELRIESYFPADDRTEQWLRKARFAPTN